LNSEKCVFATNRDNFLGHVLTDEGLMTDEEKKQVITLLKKPENTKQMMRLLGLVNYLGKFVPGLTALTEPLREIIKSRNE
jgi:hypothetical protein